MGGTMKLPLTKNKNWITLLHKSIATLDEQQQAEIMKPCGHGCAEDLLALSEKFLERKVESLQDLILGWNMIREKTGLAGKWEVEPQGKIRGIFKECGCPLVSSGLIELNRVQCYCTQGMMETIFSTVARRPVEVEIKQTIGRGDDVCHFLVKLASNDLLNTF
jgi:predicted hydrocarbon binding protein